MRSRTIEAILLVTWLTLCATRAGAQSRADDDAYHEAIGRALQEFNLGHWTEAKVFFQEAHGRKPSARTLRGIGLACYESRNYVEAIDFLQQSLVSPVQPLTAEMRAAATHLIEQSRQFVMRAQIELDPSFADLRVDGKPPRFDSDGWAMLDPGEHELSVSAPGFNPLRRRVNTEGGSQRTIHLVMTPVTPKPVVADLEPAPLAATSEVEPADRESGSVLPWLVIGGSVAVAATGGVLLGLGLADKAAVESAREGGSWATKQDAAQRSVPLQTAGGIMLGVGLAGLGAGLVWQLADSDSQERAVQVGAGSVTYRERF
jgi:hypothetical protein